MPDRRQEVFDKLALVLDPELDQSLTDLGFISEVSINEGKVRVAFRLPTYWCSPNFAYLMASGIHSRVKELSWVSSVTVSLEDHCASKEINDALLEDRSFSDAFSGMTDGDLSELRRTFEHKAFIARQERVLRELVRQGLSANAIVDMTVEGLQAMRPAVESTLIDRYITKRAELGLPSQGKDKAFTRVAGEPLAASEFTRYLSEARRSRVSLEFNANYCRGLFETRYNSKLSLVQIEGIPT